MKRLLILVLFLLILASLAFVYMIYQVKIAQSILSQVEQGQLISSSLRMDETKLTDGKDILQYYSKHIMIITGYTANPTENGGYGITAWGKKPKGRIAAVWTCQLNWFPRGSKVYIEGFGTYTIEDTMGYCTRGEKCTRPSHKHMDLLMPNLSSAKKVGWHKRVVLKELI